MAKIVILATFPVILVHLLTFIVMQRGSLKHSSTCFYMAMLAVADTCKNFCSQFWPLFENSVTGLMFSC